jgi:hypothetical protein
MTTRYSIETAGVLDGTLPAGRADGRVYGSKMRRIRASFDLSTATFANGDSLVIGDLPVGASFAGGRITISATLGSTTVAVGSTGSTAKYKAAAVFTTTDTPTGFGKASAMAQAPLAATERVLATLAAADAPASGTLVIEIFYTVSA